MTTQEDFLTEEQEPQQNIYNKLSHIPTLPYYLDEPEEEEQSKIKEKDIQFIPAAHLLLDKKSKNLLDLREDYLFACLMGDFPDDADHKKLIDLLTTDFTKPFWDLWRKKKANRTQLGEQPLEKEEKDLIHKYGSFPFPYSIALMHALGAICHHPPTTILKFWRQYFPTKTEIEQWERTAKELESVKAKVSDSVWEEKYLFLRQALFQSIREVREKEELFVDQRYRYLWDKTVKPLEPCPFNMTEAAKNLMPELNFIKESIFHPDVAQPKTSLVVGCSCVNCFESRDCPCLSENQNECPYDAEGRLIEADQQMPIFECNSQCQCSQDCRLRVIQKGSEYVDFLQIYVTKFKGLGVRSQIKIPKGSFIGEYVGERITNRESLIRLELYSKRNYMYTYSLDYDAPRGQDDEKECDEIDGLFNGSFTRFFNHSCDGGNLSPIVFFIEQRDRLFQRLAFFASKDIYPGTELTFNYHDLSSECFCGSENCRSLQFKEKLMKEKGAVKSSRKRIQHDLAEE